METEAKPSLKTYLEHMRLINEWERLHPHIVPVDTALNWNDDMYEIACSLNKQPRPSLNPEFFIRMHQIVSRLPG